MIIVSKKVKSKRKKTKRNTNPIKMTTEVEAKVIREKIIGQKECTKMTMRLLKYKKNRIRRLNKIKEVNKTIMEISNVSMKM